MADDFDTHEEGLNSPADNAAVITPSNDDDLAKATRAILVGTEGALKVDTVGGDTVTIPVAPKGLLPLRVTKVYATGTDADNLVAFW